MRSAHRKVRIENSKTKSWKISLLTKLMLPIFVLVFVFLFFRLTTRFWDGERKISFVFRESSGGVGVTVLDPTLSELTTFIVPADTEVDVARNYGTFRIKNVWQLGINEKVGGKLLAETVTNNFLFPTFLWSEINLDDPFKFVFNSRLTNIPVGDRVAMAVFALKVKGIDRAKIDLGKNQFLKKQTLTDGSLGYVVDGPISGRLTVYFSDNKFADLSGSGRSLKFTLIDATGSYGVANSVGSILEVLGGKVVSVDRTAQEPDMDCNVYGNSDYVVSVVGTLFGCTKSNDKSNFDLVMKMGTKFAKRF